MHWHLKTRKSWWLPRLRPGAELPHSLRLQSWAQGSRPKVVRRIYISIILARIRDACGNQNRWTFKKVPNGLPPPSFSENYIADSLKWLQSLRKLPEHHTCGIFSENPGYENIKNYDPGCQIQKCPKSNTSQLQILALVGSGPFHQCTFSLKNDFLEHFQEGGQMCPPCHVFAPILFDNPSFWVRRWVQHFWPNQSSPLCQGVK